MINIILQDFIYKIDNLARFNGFFTVQKKESVTQHSYWVLFYSNLIFRALYYKQIKLCDDKQTQFVLLVLYNNMLSFVLRQGIYHDFEENFTGDVLYDTKYDNDYGDDLKMCLNKIKLKKLEMMDRDILYHDYLSVLKTDNFDEVGLAGLSVDQKSVCLNVVKMADWMSSLHYSFLEIKFGNSQFENALSKAIEGIFSCVTQIQLLNNNKIGLIVDEQFFITVQSELIELKSKLNIL